MTIFRFSALAAIALTSCGPSSPLRGAPETMLIPESGKKMTARAAVALYRKKPTTFYRRVESFDVQGVADSVPEFGKLPNKAYRLLLTDEAVDVSIDLPYTTEEDAAHLETNRKIRATCFGAMVTEPHDAGDKYSIRLQDCMLQSTEARMQ